MAFPFDNGVGGSSLAGPNVAGDANPPAPLADSSPQQLGGPFFVSAVIYTATVSGGLVSDGASAAVKGKAYSPAGGLLSSGTATTGQVDVRAYVPSGGAVFSGSANLAKGRIYTPSGSLSAAGSASLAKGRSFTPAGGLVSSGSALTGQSALYTYTASAGAVLSGSAVLARAFGFTATGGLQFSGTAPTERPPQVYAYSPDGGLSLAGSAPAARPVVEVSQGFGGGDLVNPFKFYRTPGRARAFTYSPTGGLSTGGAAETSSVAVMVREHLSQGRARFSGQASTARADLYEFARRQDAELLLLG